MLETSFVDRHEPEQMSFSDNLTTFDQLQLGKIKYNDAVGGLSSPLPYLSTP